MNAPTWNIDTTHSAIHFTVRHMVFAKVRGRFSSWKADLKLDGAALGNSQVTVDVDIASIDTGVADRDAHLRSGDFFDAGTYPRMRFVSKRIEGDRGEFFKLVGDLTIRDVTREVVLDVVRGGQGTDPWGNERVGFSATASIDRGEFGLTWNQVLEAGGVLVGPRVEIEIEVQAVRAAGSKAA